MLMLLPLPLFVYRAPPQAPAADEAVRELVAELKMLREALGASRAAPTQPPATAPPPDTASSEFPSQQVPEGAVQPAPGSPVSVRLSLPEPQQRRHRAAGLTSRLKRPRGLFPSAQKRQRPSTPAETPPRTPPPAPAPAPVAPPTYSAAAAPAAGTPEVHYHYHLDGGARERLLGSRWAGGLVRYTLALPSKQSPSSWLMKRCDEERKGAPCFVPL